MSFRKPRLNRLFARTGKCFDVAIDHGFFNEASFLGGIEDLERAVRTIAEAGPDAIQLTPGQARLLQDLPGPRKPALVLRTDVANVYPPSLPAVLWSKMIDDPVGQALELDAACVVVNLLLLPGQPDLHGQCVENVCRLKPACERYGMPLMVEPLVMRPNEKGGAYMVDGDLRKIMALVRQAVELGADVIKADPCDDVREYHKVVEVAGRVPVLVRGGGKAPTAEILRRTYELMQQGARGIVYGRNVIQHPDPAGITRAFMAIVHEGATPEQAARFVQE
jgi:DhnA family fructose-bisphosphate aldolase class Ia